MTVFIVSYFYPGGTYAGTIGVYDSEAKADAAVHLHKLTDYPDCTFAICEANVE
jgi:hypothetical protein